MKGIVDVRNACSRVASSQMLAQLSSFGLNRSIGASILGMRRSGSPISGRPAIRRRRTVVPLEEDFYGSARTGWSTRKEDVMHPVITEAVAAQRARELHAHAAAARRAHQLRRSGQVSRMWRFFGFPRGGRVPAARPLRGPRAA
jgi:hypothetical protein